MASALTSKNRVYLFRLQILLIDGGNLVIRNIFNQKLQSQNSTLTVCLAQEKQTIGRLKVQKAITQTQYDLLFPQGGQAPSIADFDISLTICLLRNLKMCGLNPKYSWKSIPQSTDLSVEADITRLRTHRNEIAHISETTGIQQTDFLSKWTEIEQILLRLNNSVLNAVSDLQQIIYDFKKCSLDQKTEQRLQTQINVWQTFEKGLEEDLQRIQKDVQANTKSVFALIKDGKDVKVDVGKVTERLEDTRNRVDEVTVRLEDTRNRVDEDTERLEDTRNRVDEVTERFEDTRNRVDEVTERLEDTRNRVDEVTERLEDTRNRVDEVTERLEDTRNRVDEDTERWEDTRNRVDEVTERLEDTRNRVDEDTERLEDTRNRVDKLENLASKEAIFQKQTQDQPRYEKKKGKLAKLFDTILFRKARRRKVLKKTLVDFYRNNYDRIPLSPLIEEVDTSLTKFYVLPNINTVRMERAIGGGKEEKTPVGSLQDVFYTNRKKCNEIYLTADAGMGKTCFSKRLALAWCQAHNPIKDMEEYFSKEEIDAMKNFDLLFLLFLRDAGDECNINDLIISKIVQEVEHKHISMEELEELLSEERCLVILDGLDEWTHPSCKKGKTDVPHRKTGACTVLTTSRPWKLSVINLKSSEIDQRLELSGLDEDSANTIKMNFLSHFTQNSDENYIQEKFDDFNADIKRKEISDLEAIPLLLMYLLCLWCENVKLGESKCELYSNIIELLLSKTVKKDKSILTLAEPIQNNIPECFRKQTHCKTFYSVLATLAQLAYRTLFNEAREQTLVFDNEIAEECLNQELMQVCLQAGILSQSKDRTKLTKQKAKISFAHKTVQEFFAALYMHSAPDQITVKNKVLSQCNSVKDILEMSKVFIFLSGINVDVLSLISRELIEIINKDEITQEYRAMTVVYDSEKYTKPLKELQDMYISCVKENSQNAELKLFHQDIIIDKDCRQEKYVNYLQQLAVKNKENIRSVSVEMEGIPYSVQEIIDNFELADLRNVDKIYYEGEFHNCDITPLLQRSVKCLSLISNKWQDNQFIGELCTWPASLSSRFYSLDNLECIYISCFEMIHDELEKLMKHLSTRNSMRDISLLGLYCNDHEDSCAGFNLDLSLNSQLRKLTLSYIPLSELNINVASLEECTVGHLSKPGLVSRFLSYLPAASKLHIFKCSRLEYTEDIETMLTTLRKLVHVKEVRLLYINLGDRQLSLSPEIVNIEYVWLYKVTMAASVFSHLVSQVNKQQQTVTVGMWGCTITPEVEFEKEKDKIKKSPDFSVTDDGIDQDDEYAFVFTTIK